jgi:signal transduction histidine kinase
MRSLRLRIAAAIALVCAVTLAAVALYVGRTTLLVRVGPPPDAVVESVSAALGAALGPSGSPTSVRAQLSRLGARYDARIVLENTTTQSAISSSGPIASGTVELRGGSPILVAGKRTPWRLFVFPKAPAPDAFAPDAFAPVRGSIIDAIWKSAVLGFAVALTVAIVLGTYIVRPIRELTDAARAMSAGDTARRVRPGKDDEIGGLAAAFNRMAESIETTERLRRAMITDVAHELRSPLTRMIVQLEAARDGHLSGEDALTGARDEAKRLERIVDDLRDLSLADAHELSIPRRPLSLGDCIDDAVARMKPNAERKKIALARDIELDLPTVLGDEFRIAQILDNLVSNALRHTPAGGHIVVGARAHPGDVECFVRDDGPGIGPGDLHLVFERFYRADPSRARATGGSGLGLAIVKSLVEAQGGTIAVDSEVGKGACFSWTLPRSDPPDL